MKEFFETIEQHKETALGVAVFIYLIIWLIVAGKNEK